MKDKMKFQNMYVDIKYAGIVMLRRTCSNEISLNCQENMWFVVINFIYFS